MVGAWDEGCTVMPVNSYANYVQFMGFGADFGGTMHCRHGWIIMAARGNPGGARE